MKLRRWVIHSQKRKDLISHVKTEFYPVGRAM